MLGTEARSLMGVLSNVPEIQKINNHIEQVHVGAKNS